MPTLPTTPALTDKGEMELQGALGTNHIEGQASVSPVKHLALSGGGFYSNRNSRGYYFAVQGYLPLNTKRTLFAQANVGFETAAIRSHEQTPGALKNEDRLSATSNYDSYKVGGGLVWKMNKRFHMSFDMRYTYANFYDLGYEFEVQGWNPIRKEWSHNGPVWIPVCSPFLTGKFLLGPFFIKHTLLCNFYPAANVNYTVKADYPWRGHTVVTSDTKPLKLDELVLMVSLGLNLDWKKW